MGQRRNGSSLLLLILGLLLLVGDRSPVSVSAVSTTKIVSEAFSNAASSLPRRLWPVKSTARTAAQGNGPLVKFEDGYTVETVLDDSKLAIEPYSAVVAQSGDLLVLDSLDELQFSLPLVSLVTCLLCFKGVWVSWFLHVMREFQAPIMPSIPPYQKPMKPYVRSPLIPTGRETEKLEEEEGLFSSTRKLISGIFPFVAEIFGTIFPIFRKTSHVSQYQHQLQRMSALHVQESLVTPHHEIPPPLQIRVPTPRKTYVFMSKEPEKIHPIHHERSHFSGWDAEPSPQKQQLHYQQHLRQHQQYSSGSQTYYEQNCETTNEIVFGEVQEVDSKRRTVEIKAVNYGDPIYEQFGLRRRKSFMGCTSNY